MQYTLCNIIFLAELQTVLVPYFSLCVTVRISRRKDKRNSHLYVAAKMSSSMLWEPCIVTWGNGTQYSRFANCYQFIRKWGTCASLSWFKKISVKKTLNKSSCTQYEGGAHSVFIDSWMKNLSQTKQNNNENNLWWTGRTQVSHRSCVFHIEVSMAVSRVLDIVKCGISKICHWYRNRHVCSQGY